MEELGSRVWHVHGIDESISGFSVKLSHDFTVMRLAVDLAVPGASCATTSVSLHLAKWGHLDLATAAKLIVHVTNEASDELFFSDDSGSPGTGVSKRYSYWVGDSILIISKSPQSARRGRSYGLRLEVLVPQETGLMSYSVFSGDELSAREAFLQVAARCEEIDAMRSQFLGPRDA